MKPEPITVDHMNYHAARASQAAQMAGSRRSGISGLMFANHRESAFERPAVRGMAVRYGEVFMHEGVLTAFVKGCFTESLASGIKVGVQLEHDEAVVLASGDVRFVDTDEGLAFEFEPPKDQPGAVTISLVASGSRTDVSVGTRNIKATIRNLRGHDVRLITAADLVEISLCTDGAVKGSHARVVDLANAALSLEDEARSGVLRMTGWSNDAATATKRLRNTIDAIEARAAPKSYPVHHVWPEG